MPTVFPRSRPPTQTGCHFSRPSPVQTGGRFREKGGPSMYEFAVVTLFGLVALKVTDLLVDLVPSMDRIRTMLTFTLAVVAAVALDYSLFDGFGITIREAWMGTVGTGLVIRSVASVWATVLSCLATTSIAARAPAASERPRIAAYPQPAAPSTWPPTSMG